MRKFLRVLAWILFWPVMLPVWLSYKYPVWLRWTYWIIAVLILFAGAASDKSNNQATSGALLLAFLLAIFLFVVVKIISVMCWLIDRQLLSPTKSVVVAPLAASTPPATNSAPIPIGSALTSNPDLSELDSLDGIAFEKFVAEILSSRGYKTEVAQASNDYGIDVIALKDNIRFGVQVKRYTGSVSRTAVSDAVAGSRHWQCHASMVVTNSYFTNGAKELAESTGCVLIDRAVLAQWLAEKTIAKLPF